MPSWLGIATLVLTSGNEKERHPARHAGAADSQNAGGAEAHAWLRHNCSHPRRFRSTAARRGGIALPGAASHGAGGLGAGRMGHDREESRGALLFAHAAWPQTAR